MASLRETLSTDSLADKRMVLAMVAMFGAAVTIGLVAGEQSFLLVGAIVGLVLVVLATLAWPQAPTLAVLFILITNAAVIAVDFHGVPYIVGAATPVLLAIPLANYLIFERRPLITDSVVPLLIFFSVVQMLGVLVAMKPDAAFEKLLTFIIEALGLYFLIINTVRSRRLVRFSVWAVILGGLFLGAISAYQQFTGTFDDNYYGFAQASNAAFETGESSLQGEVEQVRLGGPLGQHNRFAQIMLMIVPLAIFRLLGERSVALRLLAAVSTILILTGAMLTFSRGGAVGFLSTIVIMAFLRYINLKQVIAFVIGLLLVFQLFPQFGTRLMSLEALTALFQGDEGGGIKQADGATQSRVTEMLAAAMMYADHPIVGVGPGMYRNHYLEYADEVGIKAQNRERQSHNLYLGLAADTGTLGIVSFTLIMFVTFRNLNQVRKYWQDKRPDDANLATGLVLALASYLATGMFLHFAFIRYFWLMVGLAGAACHVSKVEQEKYEARLEIQEKAEALARVKVD